MTFSYAWEKGYSALRSLALGEGTLRERLGPALATLRLTNPPEDFTDDEQVWTDRFEQVLEPLRRPGGGLRSLEELEEGELHDLAEALFDYGVELDREHDRRTHD